MADPFQSALDPVFAILGTPATYIGIGGSTVPLLVIARRNDLVTGFGGGELVSDGALFELRAADLTAAGIRPWAGDRLLVGDDLFEVQGAPVRRDPARLVWTLETVQIPAPTSYPQFDPPTISGGAVETVLGPNAPPGVWTGTYVTAAQVTLAVGQIVHVNAAGRLAPCRADAAATADPAGVVLIGAPAGEPARWATERPVERADWSALLESGVATLVPGTDYFLSARIAGGLTDMPPSAPGWWVVPVGFAVAPTVLHVQPGTPIQL